MTGHGLALLFTLLTVTALAVVLYRLRRRPIIWLMARSDRTAAFHRDTLAGLEAAVTSARREGREAEAARLEPSIAEHRRALRDLAAAEEFAPRRP